MQLTPTARTEILRWNQRLEVPLKSLRLSVQPGGCAGLIYDLSFATPSEAGDVAIACDDVTIYIAPDSLAYFEDLVLDYSEDLMGGSFRFSNPKVEGYCNCGISFTNLMP